MRAGGACGPAEAPPRLAGLARVTPAAPAEAPPPPPIGRRDPRDPGGGGGMEAARLPRAPPLKVLAGQLRADAEGGPGAWRLARAGRAALPLAAVWMQGAVQAAGGGEARLRDPSGPFSVRGLERVPRGRRSLEPGSYVMVMGELEACRPEPRLRAVKLTDLSDNPVHARMWELEVRELHRNAP